jgi:plasmid stabilization system protein ParE
MAARRCTVRVTANFEANLEAIEVFLAEAGATPAFTAVLGELANSVIPNLERFPEMGRLFLDRPAQSVEARQKIRQLESRIGNTTLREYVAGDFLILYGARGRTVYLLSIKHQRQLSFDFPVHWR